MGVIDPMVINSAVVGGVVPFGGAVGLWVSLVGALSIAVGAIVAAVPRRRRRPYVVRLARPAAVH